jgi:hypothetical protein
MKKFSIFSLILLFALNFIACSSDQKEVNVKESVKKIESVKVELKGTCKVDCDKKNNTCIKDAAKDKKKINACTKAKIKCTADCDAVKKTESIKKAELTKKSC